MDKNNISADHIIATLVDMGFDISKATEAIEVVGPTLQDALEFILSRSSETNNEEFHSITCSTSQNSTPGCVPLCSSNRMKQSSIKDHLHPFGGLNNNIPHNNSAASCSSAGGMRRSNRRKLDREHISNVCVPSGLVFASEYAEQVSDNKKKYAESLTGEICRSPSFSLCYEEVELNWEQKVGDILPKHFGFSCLKGFQRKALEAWSANRDCLVLAATGSGIVIYNSSLLTSSGKSLCFQIPALLTSKVVIVVSPLISLMHDQCLNLAKRGISACFLGSGQPDCNVEHKAMCGMYKIVYVCPETILRLIEPLRRLAVNPGIALFAIDEVHCVSKWGHDFRPDYRRLSVLRDNFNSCCLESLQFDIPLMALTATATTHVQEDIIKSLHMSNETEIILTSFFRPNLRFSVKHSKTNSVSSYYKDFKELIKLYVAPRMTSRNEKSNFKDKDDVSDCYSSDYAVSVGEDTSISDDEDRNIYKRRKVNPVTNSAFPIENQLTVEYLEDELDSFRTVDDLDVSCGDFPITSPSEILKTFGTSELLDASEGPTIIYVPTRKETFKIAEFLSNSGVRAAAYHAKLTKTHLRKVHDEFHQGSIQVVVATIAFGMGIDKSNVGRIIHYGWPQSLEAYYQEAGRAGRDGKLSDCTLYANLSRIPTLLPSQRSEEQTKQAYKMLSDCFRYAMCTTSCRAKALVGYFAEEFSHDGCHLCDVCVAGPPKIQNMKAEVNAFLGVLEAECRHADDDDYIGSKMCTRWPNLRMVVSRIREKFQEFATSDRVWWQGLARILENKGFIKEADVLARVSIRFPQITEAGLKYLHSKSEEIFLEYPEADMLLSAETCKPYSSFSEWGRGWADPEIRRQRLQRKRKWKKKRRSSSSKQNENLKTVRGRLAAKLSKGFK